MSSIKMVALRRHPFGTGEREAGDEYEATADESAILIALGWAQKAGGPRAAKPAIKKEQKALAAAATDKKRTYQRRDLKAKD